ncbi:hypothetical protein BGW36DRAFT_357530 [Talaromyces proteolyticus]|uniref:Tyrosinase copper-binding domain-containing protein n=1 Tax=Talaromyces proteolyticus TaxID=1131652 RepID=A0AAD4KVS2_9EURO|nr:uncharacterized protein BGW36DRAFT_357530 [Talaromyces proteolyticus]KAH8700891.1 hypothetical protein BGW36DRAFT_357530 [Talaromyces proteolyticus]
MPDMVKQQYFNLLICSCILSSYIIFRFDTEYTEGPRSIANIFLAFADPVFFLHYAQIDRLWWKWQIKEQNGGFRGYDSINGVFEPYDDTALISDKDMLIFTGLGDDLEAEKLGM